VAYRTASAVKTGACVRTEDTATLPPTQTMAKAPAATPVTVPRREDLVEAKHASDLGSPALPQLVLAHLIASGELAHRA